MKIGRSGRERPLSPPDSNTAKEHQALERARVNGIELEYEISGTGEPVLLIHGSHVAGSFRPLLAQPELTDEYMLIRYHRRSHLDSSPATGPVSIEQQAADARALLEYLRAQPAHVVGHSYGGAVAMQLALDAPKSVHSLALLEAALLTVPRGRVVSELNALAARLYKQGDWEAAEDFFLGTPKERAVISRNIPGGFEQALRDMDTYFAIEVPAHNEWEFSAAEGNQIKQPVLFMLGGESAPLYVECHDAIREWMPQTETVILSGASHLLHIQEPAGAAVLLRGFFTRHPIRPARDEGRTPRKLRAADTYNATTDLLDNNLECGRTDKVAIRTHWGDWTYGDVALGANRVGNALRGLGLEVENRVLMAVPDSPEFATTFFATIKVGAVPVPVNTNLRPEEYAYLLADTRAKIAVVGESVAPAVQRARRGAGYPRHVVVVGKAGHNELSFEEITRDAEDAISPAGTRSDDMCFWLYSLGRTGRPKGVVHLQHDMRFCADTYAKHVLEIDEPDTTFSISKLCYAYGLGCGLYFPFSAGATTVLLDEPPQPRAVLALTNEFHPTIFCGISTSYASLLAAAVSAWKSSDFGSVRVCVSATEALSGSLLKRWKERTGLDILDGIGATESCHIFISNRIGDVRPDCSGTVVEGFEAKIVNDGGQELPPGERGMLMVKGDSICAFYWHEHELTKETILGDWLKTGDTYVKDESGYFFYQGRADDMLKVGGMWVSPREIETILDGHERVAECAVVGVQDNDGLVRPEAFVVLENSGGEQALEATLRQHVRQHLGGNKTPRALHFVKSLPESVRGELQMATPREPAGKGDAGGEDPRPARPSGTSAW